MKKIMSVLFACVFMMMVFVGCKDQPIEKSSSSSVVDSTSETKPIESTTETTATTAEITTEPSDEEPIGNRKNPVPFNTDFTTEYVKYSYSGESRGYTIKVSEILRGPEAETMAVEANRFNAGKVPEGKDLILFKVDFTLNKITVEESFLCSGIYFDYFSGTFSEETTFISIAGLDDLHAELYEGGSTSGWLYTLADSDDPSPLARFDDTVWLALYK